jgi:hypothetical protein
MNKGNKEMYLSYLQKGSLQLIRVDTTIYLEKKNKSYTVILHLIVLKKCKKLDYLSYQIEFSHVLYLALYLTTNATQALVRELSANFINEK